MLCNVFTLLVATALMSSCEKMTLSESAESIVSEDANVVLRVVGFEQTPFSAKTRAKVGDVCSKLNFVVYDTNGDKVTSLAQDVGEANFGAASFVLEEGTFHLVVVGHNASSSPSFKKGEKVSITGKNLSDTFWGYMVLNVGPDKLSRELKLKRIVSLVRFIPLDDFPEKADSLEISYKGNRGSFYASTGYGSVGKTTSQSLELAFDKTEHQFEFYMIPIAERDTLSATIKSYRKESDIKVYPTTINVDSIPVRRNCVTTCRGYLFKGKGASTFVDISITIDDDWEKDSIIYNF